MMDHFAVLGLPRRAALDPDGVRSAFQSRAAECHPDRGGSEADFEAASQAHAALSDPASRLRHLHELFFGEPPNASAAVDAGTMALFEQVAPALAAADGFLKRKAAAKSAIARALLAEEEAQQQAALFAASGSVRGRAAELAADFESLDAALVADAPAAREELAAKALALAFTSKWQRQLAERMAGLI